ncbi:hypothetical protein HDV00_012566 [Rhizophlyctis rosea]|nr:hypothetical protein HDV00_012566 [Rhizophlyctis rosea]
MGGSFSVDLEPISYFCKQQAQASQACMEKYNYDRDKYRGPCRQAFQDYKDCKARWSELKTLIQRHDIPGQSEWANPNIPPPIPPKSEQSREFVEVWLEEAKKLWDGTGAKKTGEGGTKKEGGGV